MRVHISPGAFLSPAELNTNPCIIPRRSSHDGRLGYCSLSRPLINCFNSLARFVKTHYIIGLVQKGLKLIPMQCMDNTLSLSPFFHWSNDMLEYSHSMFGSKGDSLTLLCITHSEWRPQNIYPKRKWTSIVSSNWQQKFLYFHYKSVKLDVLGRQNKMAILSNLKSCQFAHRIVIFNLCICCQFEDLQIISPKIIPMSHHNI